MGNNKKLRKKMSKISKKVDALEAFHPAPVSHKPSAGNTDSRGQYYCSMPIVVEREFGADVSQFREELIRPILKKWVNGTVLRYYFFDSGSFKGQGEQIELVRQGFDVWKNVGIGVTFQETTNIEEAEVRIGFLQDGRSWSFVGRDVIDVPGQYERTMNFGWDLTADTRGVDTPVHEIGHTLGFTHEHQNPISGIVWDEAAVYNYFMGPPNDWPRETVFHNILRRDHANSMEGSIWDPDSIMHYGLPGGLILEPAQYRNGVSPARGLSETDIAEARRLYPPIVDDRNELLFRYQLKQLDLQPSEQANFDVNISSSDDYSIQTFGRSDTVMVLFEDVDGQLRMVAANDDSGLDTNAKIEVRLQQGRKYILRVRLYSNYASGTTALMMW